MTNRLFKLFMKLALVIFFVSCTSKNVTEEIMGTYFYEFPSEELSILIMKNDSTFNQKIFKTVEDFNNKSIPIYQSDGYWSIEKENKLYFNNWLSYCWLRHPDSILSEPSNSGMSGIYWNKPTKKNDALISIYSETGYVFEKSKFK